MDLRHPNHTRDLPSPGRSPFVILNVALFLVFSNVAFLYLYPLAIHAMGGGSRVIGWVMGLFSLSAVLSRPFMGKIVAGKGEYPVISGGIGVMLLASLGYYLIERVGPGMFLVRVLHGLGFSAFIAGTFSWIAGSFPEGKRGSAYGMVGASIMGAAALAPPFGEFLIRKYGFLGLYSGAVGAVLMALIAMRGTGFSFKSSVRAGTRKARYLPLLRNRPFLFLLVSTLVFGHCQSLVFNFLALIAGEKGAGSGRFFFVSLAVAILVLLTTGRIIDRYGKLALLRLSYPFFSLGILLIPLLVGVPRFFLSAVLFGVGMGFLFPTHNALAAGHGDGGEKPAVMSAFTAVYDTGFITGAVVSGWIAALTDLDTLFYITGFLGLAGFGIALLAPLGERQTE